MSYRSWYNIEIKQEFEFEAELCILIPVVFYCRWSPLTIWPQGVIVKHSKVSYKAVGKQNTAVPGDGPQSRLYVSQFSH